MRMSCDDMQFCCGVTEIGNFDIGYEKKPDNISSGTGFAVATFNESNSSKEAYKWLKKHFKILYQSEPRGNAVHNNESKVFIVVYEVNKDAVIQR